MKPLHAVGLVVLVGVLTGLAGPAHATGRTVVLDTTGYWRLHHALAPPVIELDNQLTPIQINDWLDRATDPPGPGWRELEHDDSTWSRGPARINARTPWLKQLSMRARFTVDDPQRVEDLRLTLAYHGGAVVYLNGREIARAHLPEGELGDDTLAEAYPREAFVAEGGGLLQEWDGRNRERGDENQRRLALRTRTIQDLPVPADALVEGVNVLAIEIHRAPYHAAVHELRYDEPSRRGSRYNLPFNTCEIQHVQLSGAPGIEGAISVEAVRPVGLQVFNSNPLATDFDLDFAGPSERLYPVRIVAPRGGIASGKVVVGARRAIENLAGRVEGELPVTRTRVRYGLPWGSEEGVWGSQYTYWDMNYSRYPRHPRPFGALADAPTAVVEVREVGENPGSDLATPDQPEPVFGATVPVWVTFDVARDAPAGVHQAELVIEATGEPAMTVPVELVVADWTVPTVEDRRVFSELIQVPDTTALEYELEMWSEEHWAMIAQAFALIGETSSRVVHLPLVAHTNKGAAESMVRWRRTDDGGWEHDFSVLERYLDTAIEHMGEPDIVVLHAWEIYQLHPERARESSSHNQEARALSHIADATGGGGTGPVVTTVDGDTATLPHFDEPGGKSIWQPVFDEVLALLEARGLSDAASVGSMSDAWPNPGEVEALAELTGNLPWVSYSHMGVRDWRVYDIVSVRYQATVTQNRYANNDPPLGSLHGWAGSSWPRRGVVPVGQRLEEEGIFAENPRGGRGFDNWPASRLRHVGEFNITGDQRGIGRVGADYWSAVRDRRDRRVGRAAARFPQSSWRNQDLASSLLAPGPEGPVATPNFEAFREGLQEAEARALVELALLDEAWRARLDDELIARAEALLVERTHLMLKSLGQMRLTGPMHWYVTGVYTYWHRAAGPIGHQWFLGSGWQSRSEALFELAGELERRRP